MSMYKQMKQSFIQEYKERPQIYKERIVKWSAESPITRIERPTNIARARELGYKAKQGVIVARVRVLGGTKKRPQISGGRKPSKAGRFFSRQKSTQAIAEERAANKFSNCEVLNSYFVAEAGQKKFFEVILVERGNPSIDPDPDLSRIMGQRNRVFRGLTYSGRTHRGVARRGYGTRRFRPSRRSNERTG